jgi:hypothetical protein
MKVRSIYLRGRCYKLNNGRHISFCKDTWLNNCHLCLSYPILFDLCTDQNCSIYDVAQNGWVLNFKIRLHGILRGSGMSWP